MNKPLVLFLCTANSARSQMAEALLRQIAGHRFEVASAGIDPAQIHPLTIRVMEEIGISVRGQRSKSVTEFLAKVPVRYPIAVCEAAEQRCPRIWPFGGRLSTWPLEDPVANAESEEAQLARFRDVRDQLANRIQQWIKSIPEE